MTTNGHAAHFDNLGVTIIEKDIDTIAATGTVFACMYLMEAKPLERSIFGTLLFNSYEGNAQRKEGLQSALITSDLQYLGSRAFPSVPRISSPMRSVLPDIGPRY